MDDFAGAANCEGATTDGEASASDSGRLLRRRPAGQLRRPQLSGRALAGATAALALVGAAGAARADALATPAMTAPLSGNANPISFDGGPLGKVYVGGALTGLGLAQSHRVPGDNDELLDISNGQVFIQTTSGPVQFFLEAGAYSFPSLGTPYLKSGSNTDHTFSALPVAYVKLQPTAEISILAGKLPTLIGSEYAFTFQNMNIERGLLWNQEPVFSKGVQANYAKGPVTVSLSINDGFDSDHYNWFSGLASYAFSANDTLAFNGGVNFASSAKSSFVTPIVQNNSAIFNVNFTHVAGPLTISPYFQYTRTDENQDIGVLTSVSSYGGAVLAKYNFTPEIALAGRVEYISSSSGNAVCALGEGVAVQCPQTNILYGPGSDAFSVTLTPTWQVKAFFVRGEISYVRAGSFSAGYGFGDDFNDRDQVRGLLETGVIF